MNGEILYERENWTLRQAVQKLLSVEIALMAGPCFQTFRYFTLESREGNARILTCVNQRPNAQGFG